MCLHPLASPEDGAVVEGGKVEVFVELGVVGEGDGVVDGAACEEEGEERGRVAPGGGGDEVEGRAGEELGGESVERLGLWHAGQELRGGSNSPTNNNYISLNYTPPHNCPPSVAAKPVSLFAANLLSGGLLTAYSCLLAASKYDRRYMCYNYPPLSNR